MSASLGSERGALGRAAGVWLGSAVLCGAGNAAWLTGRRGLES